MLIFPIFQQISSKRNQILNVSAPNSRFLSIFFQLNEEKRIQSIIAKKKEDLLEKLRLETNAKQAAVIPEFDKKKLDAELARATAEIQKKYDEKLKEVVRTQKQLYDIEHAKDVDEAVLKERNV